jgi:hypothetical protein
MFYFLALNTFTIRPQLEAQSLRVHTIMEVSKAFKDVAQEE